MADGTLVIDPTSIDESEWLPAVQNYVRAAHEAGEIVKVQSRPQFLTPEQAGEQLGMSRTTVVRAIKAGELNATKVGNRHRIPVRELERFRRKLLDDAVAEISEGVDPNAPVPDDPVAVYDVMREAANRLVAAYAKQVTAGGIDDPAIVAIRALRAEVDAVAWNDLPAQKAMTKELVRRHDELANQAPASPAGGR